MAKSNNSYYNRALQSADPRYLLILSSLGYGPLSASTPTPAPFVPAPLPVPPPDPPPVVDDDDDGPPDNLGQQLKAAREEYERVTGKRPFNGWDVAELHKRIADFKRGNP
jgi:hypothetical protein